VAFRSVGEDARQFPAHILDDSRRMAEQGPADGLTPTVEHAPRVLASNPFLAQLFAQEQPTTSKDHGGLTTVQPKRVFAAYREILESPLLAAARAEVEVIPTGSRTFDLEA
jgi:hypothetical protein